MIRLPLICIALISFALPLKAETISDPVSITDIYSYATSEKQKHGAIFFTIMHQNSDDRLISAKTDVSEIVELHTHIMDGDVMKMRKVEAMDIPDNGHLELKPRADHIMLIGLNRQLIEGESFPLTLTFENAGERVIEVPILKSGTKPSATATENHQHNDEHEHDEHSHH